MKRPYKKSIIATMVVAGASLFPLVSHARPDPSQARLKPVPETLADVTIPNSFEVNAGIPLEVEPDYSAVGDEDDRDPEADADETLDLGETPSDDSVIEGTPFEALLGDVDGATAEAAASEGKSIARGGGRARTPKKKKTGIRAAAKKKAKGAARSAGKKAWKKGSKFAKKQFKKRAPGAKAWAKKQGKKVAKKGAKKARDWAKKKWGKKG